MSFEFNKKIVFGIVSSEKASLLRDSKSVAVLLVDKDASKSSVKKECERVFAVKVDSVNLLIHSKTGSMFRGRRGGNKLIKKAYVKIASDSGFDFSKLQ